MSAKSPLEELPAVAAYLNRISARMVSLFRAATMERIGQYEREVSVIRFNRSGEVFAREQDQPTTREAEEIAEQISNASLPTHVTLTAVNEEALPTEIKHADPEARFELRTRTGSLVMFQVRVEKENGDKRYVPWTYWSDGEWRATEPEGRLPIYGAETCWRESRIWIHEGAKAARAAQRIAKNPGHPFHEQFESGAHIGWIAGVHAAHRADWSEIRSADPDEIIVCCDNDWDGTVPLDVISRQFRCPVRAIERWGEAFPRSWDVADPIPPGLFYEGYYTGPLPLELARSIDWATDQVPAQGRGRPTYRIRENFARQWCWVESLQRFALMDEPTRLLNKEQFQARVARYSHTTDTARYLLTGPVNRVDELTFDPSTTKRFVDGGSKLNQYVDHRLRPAPGDTSLWHDFLEYLIPDETDRANLQRWMTTVFAQPSRRVSWGVLLLSRTQGVGKSTIGEVMKRLIGPAHCSAPGEASILGDFNQWLVHKRLAIVHEIYAGQNWKAYNRLKSLMTEDSVEINIKHLSTFDVPNYVSFLCASNSMEALRLERGDRRWFVPGVNEEKWGTDKYSKLWKWIRSGGLHALSHELRKSDAFVEDLNFAPVSASKDDLIEASRPEEEILLRMLLEHLQPNEAMESNEVWLWIHNQTRGKTYITPERASRVVKDMGFGMSTRRFKVNGHDSRIRAIATTQDVADQVADIDDPRDRAKRFIKPETVFERSNSM